MLDPSTETTDDEITVVLDGEYDIARAADLRHQLLDPDLATPNVAVDLTDVAFMDSSALRALLEVRSTLTDRGGSLRLASVPPAIAVLLDITGTADLFGVDVAVG
jgi:anti-sigma B factor antagonist